MKTGDKLLAQEDMKLLINTAAGRNVPKLCQILNNRLKE